MDRFYFDINDGRARSIDREGQELADLEAAQVIATRELVLMVRDEIPNGPRESYVVTVRNGMGIPVYVATMNVLCETLLEDP